MKTYCKNIDITSYAHLSYAYEEFGKQGRKNCRKYEDFFARDMEAVMAEAKQMIESRELRLDPIHYFSHTEPVTRKKRIIGRECPMQQYLDCVAELALEELLTAKVGYHQCASIKGKGQSHARKYIQRWVKSSNSRFFVKLDIRKYYNNVDREVLFKMLHRDVKNEALLWLIEALISTHREGISIGSRLSQRLANYYLAGAYHMVLAAKHERKSRRSGEVVDQKLAKHALTYMDDWLIISKSAKFLKMVVRKLERYMRDVLHLELKPWKICRVGIELIDMVGFVFHKGWTTVRASIFIRARRAFKWANRALVIKPHMAARCIAYWGYFKATATKFFVKNEKVRELITACKDVISIRQQERNWYAENMFGRAA